MKVTRLGTREDRGAVSLRLLVTAAVIALAGGLGGLGAPASAAPSDGTVKIDGKDITAQDPANDPKLTCAVPMEFQAFDAGTTYNATITFEGQGNQPNPVVSGGDLTPTFVGVGSGVALFQTYYVAGADHIKITVNIDNGYNKFKVFKVEPCAAPTFTVAKANNANGDLLFSASEQAATAGAAVPFLATIKNTSPYSITVSAVSDAIDGTSGVPVACVPAVATIPANGIATCAFTLTPYAPAAGGTKTNTVSVSANQLGAPAVARTVTSNVSTVTTAAVPAAVQPTLELVKSNDADGKGDFEVSDVADSVAKAVPFQVTIKNTSTFDVVLDSVTDAVVGGGTTAWTCAALGTTIASGATATCSFTMSGYSPAADGTQKKNTVDVVVHQVGAASNTASLTSPQSVVTTVLPLIDARPTCQTDPVLCPVTPSCPTTPSLCPPVVVTPVVTTPANTAPVETPAEAPPVTPPAVTPPAEEAPVPPTEGGGVPVDGVEEQPATGEEPAEEPAEVGGATEEPAAAPATPRSLPFTGGSADSMLALAAGLSLAGLMLALAGRRRRTTE